MNDLALVVRDVVKEYSVYSRPADVALEVLTRKTRHTKFRALDGVSFEVERGQVLGIIGSNGAGKSTLLKIITGVLEATSGDIQINGKVTAILELGLGFNPEYSGRDNIYLSSLLYGMSREECEQKIEAIIDFSGIRAFIDRPVKTYSSGMHSRLAFSIATAVDPDILIIDEALAAGDAGFVQKSLKRIRELCSGGRTVILVSHGTGLLAQLCNKVIWIEQGRKRMEGPAINVVQAYDLAAHQAADQEGWIEAVDDTLDRSEKPELAAEAMFSGNLSGNADLAPDEIGGGTKQVFRRGPVLIDSVQMINHQGEVSSRVTLLRPFAIQIAYRTEGELPTASLGVALAFNNKHDLSPVAQFMTQNIMSTETRESYDSSAMRVKAEREGTIEITFDYVPFRKGEYILSIGLLPNEPGNWQFYEYRHLYYSMSVDDAGMDVGAPIFLAGRVSGQPMVEGTVEKPPGGALPASTLREEIDAICFREGRYPAGWRRHLFCPACRVGRLRPHFSKYGFNHDHCIECGFTCVNPYPSDEILARLYDGEYYTKVRELFEYPLLARGGEGTPFSAPVELLTRAIHTACANRERGAWLDVGGGIGAFANLIRSTKPGWDVRLNELNSRSAELAGELFGFEGVVQDLASLKAAGETYDVVSTVAVLEHVPDPMGFVEACLDVLKPGGCLLNVVPHFSRLNALVSQGSSPNVVPPYHASLFSEASLRALLQRAKDGERTHVEQFGDPCFKLIEHVDFGDHWDISVPTKETPTPQSIQVKPYTALEGEALTVLAEADAKFGAFFAETDGRLYLVSYLWKRK